MEIIKDIPTQSISPDLWKAGFMLLAMAFLFLIGHLVNWFKTFVKSMTTGMHSLDKRVTVAEDNLEDVKEDVAALQGRPNIRYKMRKG